MLHSFNDILHLTGIQFTTSSLDIILPIGISFYTFQTVGYLIEVYKGSVLPELDFKKFALYVAFFPLLLAGPIERAQNLLPQFYRYRLLEYKMFMVGIRLIIWGFFQKLVIADRLALVVNRVYDNPTNYEGFGLLLATLFFGFQIYCDFAGYSNIARGSARVLGITVMNNFKRPYFSKSITEFWRRWHISLSSWFRDYIYIPLGGNRVPILRWCFNVMVVFIISGLWHGANWNFIIWGGLYGAYFLISRSTKKIREKVTNVLFGKRLIFQTLWSILFTFILVTVTWIFFRANSLTDIRYIMTHILSDITLKTSTVAALGGFNLIILSVFFITLLVFVEFLQENNISWWRNKSKTVSWISWVGLVLVILLFGVFEDTGFIYFQF